ncbi:urease subunit beta [Sutcliffiella halmapala]|uniref:urease subunit beta n=1 Tax=Sutcliffiella halmapala TaxID=79882 RepID=UPI000995BDEF|nr:urease subunit beta [Sutcliffiella halmapala]
MVPGEYRLKSEMVTCNVGKTPIKIEVINKGDRPVQVGSHFHFFEINSKLAFDREKAFGKRLNIPAGTAVRFEPGDEREVELIPFSGERRVYGLNNLTNDALDKGV